ncbi:MAG: sigma-54 dependent transcriptional regulator [Myxococcales bacterium]|nr:sigma-54 dependent transcriptional regulator [Myxococcales bacterium]
MMGSSVTQPTPNPAPPSSQPPRESSERPRIMIVEDNAQARNALATLLKNKYDVEACDTAEAAREKFPKFRPDVLLTDIRLPGSSGLTLIPAVLKAIPECIVLVMTGYPFLEDAVAAMRSGARDFIVKPINFEALQLVLQRELRAQETALEVKRLREQLVDSIRDEEAWGDSAEMQHVLRMASEVANSRATVLITGESGTGKEVMARFLHRHSDRADGPFVAVNCAAVPENLLESEFFGHEEGSFNGAIAQKIGRFERAHTGTIFLDEIGDLSPTLQVKLLRVLQERQLERVGGTSPVDVDVRVIAATNRDLESLRDDGEFRGDLYWRLNVFQLHMPPLRRRKSDIGGLWGRFLERYAKREGLPVPKTIPEAFHALFTYEWPGNVRELENVAERAVILSHGLEIHPAHLPPQIRNFVVSEEAEIRIPGCRMDELEKIAILRTLAAVDGSTSKAAEILGISVRKIQYRMREWRQEAEKQPISAQHLLDQIAKTGKKKSNV